MLYLNNNGSVLVNEGAAIDATNRSYLYGDGVFESIRIFNGKAINVENHIHRLLAGARAVKMRTASFLTVEYFSEKINELIQLSGINEGGRCRISLDRVPGGASSAWPIYPVLSTSRFSAPPHLSAAPPLRRPSSPPPLLSAAPPLRRASQAPRRYEAALQSFVLLKNGPPPSTSSTSFKESVPVLPLKIGSKIAVLGPQAVAREGLLEDYAADQQVLVLAPTAAFAHLSRRDFFMPN